MILSDLLVPEAILPSIKAPSKKRLLQEISFGAANVYGLDQLEVLSALQAVRALAQLAWVTVWQYRTPK